MQFALIDSHCHAQFPAYADDRDAVIRRALDVGIGIVNVGTQHSTSRDAIELAEHSGDGVWATAGFHPGHTDLDSHHDPMEFPEKRQEIFSAQQFLELARHPKVVAIGECGLDYVHFARERRERLQSGASADSSAIALATAEASGAGGLPHAEIGRIKRKQQEVFRSQIELAAEVKKSLVVHCRQAFPDLIKVLDSRFQILNSPAGVIHFFSGSWEEAQKLLNLGFYLGFGGVITFARDYDEALTRAPLDRILVETDAPYVAPLPYRGKRNEPAFIVETVRKIAELRGVGYDEIASATVANTKRLFGL